MLESGRWRCQPSVRISVAHANNKIAETKPLIQRADSDAVVYRSRDRASSLLFTATIVKDVLLHFHKFLCVHFSVVKIRNRRDIDRRPKREWGGLACVCIVYNKSG